MKLIHLSDLHLGKRVNEYSMLEDQEYIIKKILGVIDEECPDGVIIAGDVYDKSVPSAEAVQLFDEFLVSLAKRKLEVFVISGNHDSPERIAFGSRIMDASGIHLSPVYDGEILPITMEDEYGPVDIYLLPFVKPAHVRRFHEDREIVTYTDAVSVAIEDMHINPARRNVLVTHQFVTGASRCESEEISVGGSDNVDAEALAAFDYVALGHIHSPQNCGTKRVRYCGTPLKYSFSEAKDHKSVTIVELAGKGQLAARAAEPAPKGQLTVCAAEPVPKGRPVVFTAEPTEKAYLAVCAAEPAEKCQLVVRTVDLVPKRDMVELRGTYEELTLRSFYENTSWQEDYVHITLTDEEDVPDAIGKLRTIYHNLMKLDYDNKRTRAGVQVTGAADVENRTPLELFADFYELQNNQPMSEEQIAFMKTLIEKTWEEGQL